MAELILNNDRDALTDYIEYATDAIAMAWAVALPLPLWSETDSANG